MTLLLEKCVPFLNCGVILSAGTYTIFIDQGHKECRRSEKVARTMPILMGKHNVLIHVGQLNGTANGTKGKLCRQVI